MKTAHGVVFFIIFQLVLVCSCSMNKTPGPEEIKRQVSALKTLEEKRLFLEKIITEIEALEMKERAARFAGTKELEELAEEKESLNLLNQRKISAYFKAYGYPSRAELGQYAAFAPYAVIYYADKLELLKEDEFKYFFGAYRFNDIPEELFLNYLELYYEKRNGTSFRIDRRASPVDNIETILDSLGIEY